MHRFTYVFVSLLLLCHLNSAAQWTPKASLTIFSEDGAKFYLILNGERYNDRPQTNIRIEELPNPYYNCKIIFENKAYPQINKSTLMLADADGKLQDVTYRIKTDKKGKLVLRFYSFVPAQQYNKRPANCATYRFGTPNELIDGPGFIQPNATQKPYSEHYNTSENNKHNNKRNIDNHLNSAECYTYMRQNDFDEAKATILKSNFDETRRVTAKQIIESNCMNANQIAEIITLFNFEDSKLDFAKYAYEFCTDRNNYFKVSNSFKFESSKIELNKFIQQRN